MSAKRKRPASAILDALAPNGGHAIGRAMRDGLTRTALQMASAELRYQGTRRQTGGHKGTATKRRKAATFTQKIAEIRAKKPHLSETAAIRWHLQNTDPAWDTHDPDTQTRLIRNAQRRLRFARARK